MTGMNRTSGTSLQGTEHLAQSIGDILTTPLGTRLERRTYGSLLPDLIDYPDNSETQIRMYAAVASALMRWEPRLRLSSVRISKGSQMGRLNLEIAGENLQPTGKRPMSLRIALQMRGAA